MGKRELLIVLAFIVVGTVAYQLTATPAKESSGGFSFSKLVESAKREMRGNQSYTAPPRTSTYSVAEDITELRLVGSAGPVRIQGEARADVSLELTVFSTGETEAAAIAIAGKTTVKEDRIGGVLTLTVGFPTEETQTSAMVLKIPQRLAVRLESTRETTTISGVRAVELTNAARGATQIDHIAEHVTGEQSAGTITLASIKTLRMTFTRTRGRVSDITGEATLDIRDGDTEITGTRGALVIEERRGDITIRNHTGTIKVTGQDGQVRIEGATGEVRLDLRRAEVDAQLASGVAGSLVTTDEELRVSWSDPASVHLDAAATTGEIDGADWGLTPVKSGTDTRIDAMLGAKSATAPRVSLRNQNANIVLKKSSKK